MKSTSRPELTDICPICKNDFVLHDENGGDFRPCWACQGKGRIFEIDLGCSQRRRQDAWYIALGMIFGVAALAAAVKLLVMGWDFLERWM